MGSLLDSDVEEEITRCENTETDLNNSEKTYREIDIKNNCQSLEVTTIQHNRTLRNINEFHENNSVNSIRCDIDYLIDKLNIEVRKLYRCRNISNVYYKGTPFHAMITVKGINEKENWDASSRNTENNQVAILNTTSQSNTENSQVAILSSVETLLTSQENYYCTFCNSLIDSNIYLTCHCLWHFYKENHLKNNDIVQFSFNEDGDQVAIKCLLCETEMNSDKMLVEHLQNFQHCQRLKLLPQRKRLQSYNSVLKESINTEINSADDTFEAEKHIRIISRENMIKVLTNVGSEKFEIVGSKSIVESDFLDLYQCFVCNEFCNSLSSYFQHLQKEAHINNITCFHEVTAYPEIVIGNLNNQVVLLCNPCFLPMYNYEEALSHINSSQDDVLHNKISEILSENKNDNQKSISNKLHQTNTNCAHEEELESTYYKKSLDNGHNQLTNSSRSLNNPFVFREVLNGLIDFHHYEEDGRTTHELLKSDSQNSFICRLSKKLSIYANHFITLCIEPGEYNIYDQIENEISTMKLSMKNMVMINEYQSTISVPCVGELNRRCHQNEWLCFKCDVKVNENQIFYHLQCEKHLENLLKVATNESRELSESYMQAYVNNTTRLYYCYPCKVSIYGTRADFMTHIITKRHTRQFRRYQLISEDKCKEIEDIAKDNWYSTQMFYCDICKQKFDFEIDFAIHLLSNNHKVRVHSCNIQTKFYTCPTCVTFGCGGPDATIEHFKSNMHMATTEKESFIIPDMPKIVTDCLFNVNETVRKLILESDRAISQQNQIYDVVNSIVQIVQPAYPKAVAYLFGSRLSRLAFPDSDVDIFLDCDNVYSHTGSKELSQFYLESVLNFLKYEDMKTWVIQEIILEARAPLVKMKHICTGFHCDISFSNGLTIEKSKLIGVYNTSFPICQQLILFLKKWLLLSRLSGPKGITTFSISWCVIFYLQTRGILPSVYKLFELKNESKIVGGWECGFIEHFYTNSSELEFFELLKGFFKFYSIFDYRRYVICPLLGQPVKKRCLANASLLPEEMRIYKQNMKAYRGDFLRIDSPMCIQDPIEQSQNTTKATPKLTLRIFRDYCSKSANLLTSFQSEQVGYMSYTTGGLY